MNVPSIALLDGIGFDAAIDRAAALLGYTSPEEIRSRFPRVFPLGLGVNSTSPLRMARAFAIFGNQGREVTPMAIRSIDDRQGRLIMDLERDLRTEQRRKGGAIQVVSPQNAYIVTSMLQKTLERGPAGHGTLWNPTAWGTRFVFKDENGNNFKMPIAGKTGTTQNWQDAWTVGFSPYMTTAVWFGFDRPGNSLGLTLTGSTLAGPVWANYMREIHLGLPFKDFVRPASGIVEVTVCAVSGLLAAADCNDGRITLPFLEGTQPTIFCDVHGNDNRGRDLAIRHLELDTVFINPGNVLGELSLPVIRDEQLLREFQQADQRNAQAARQNNRNQRTPARRGAAPAATGNFANPLLEDLPPVNVMLDTMSTDIVPPTVPEIHPVVVETESLGGEPQVEVVPEEAGQIIVDEADFLSTPPLFNPLID